MSAQEEAHRLIEEGFTVVPAHHRGKTPVVPWAEWQDADPPDAVFADWLSTKYKQCNYAIICGKQIIVIDTDSAEAEVWVKENLAFTPRTVKTARGRHFYFQVTPNLEIRNSTNASAKIDIRGSGGIVIAPGSIHESGAVYTEEIAQGCDGDWRELPRITQEDISKIERYNNPLSLVDASITGVIEGNRNDEACRKTGVLLNQGYTHEEIVEDLLRWNENNAPPMSRVQVNQIVTDIIKSRERQEQKKANELIEVKEELTSSMAPQPFLLTDFADIPPRQWIYGRHYIRKFLSVTVAAGGSGKTALTLCEAMAMACGKPLLGTETEQRRVWVWNLEDPLEELQRRLAAICLHYEIDQDDYRDHLFVNSGRDSQLVIAEQSSNQSVLTPAVEVVTEFIQAYNIDVVLVDPFVSSHRLNENDNSGMDLVVKAWGKIAEQGQCAVELVHHVRKAQQGQSATYGDARGASALTDAARHVRRLVRMTADEARLADIDEDQAWRYTREADSKDNLAPPTTDNSWREMRSIDLPNGDNVGVIEKWDWPDPFSDVTVNDLEAVKRALKGEFYRFDVRSKQWYGYAAADCLGMDGNEAAVKSKIKQLMSTWIKNNEFETYDMLDPKTRREFKYIRPLFPSTDEVPF